MHEGSLSLWLYNSLHPQQQNAQLFVKAVHIKLNIFIQRDIRLNTTLLKEMYFLKLHKGIV